jgi:hypothetical protein
LNLISDDFANMVFQNTSHWSIIVSPTENLGNAPVLAGDDNKIAEIAPIQGSGVLAGMLIEYRVWLSG